MERDIANNRQSQTVAPVPPPVVSPVVVNNGINNVWLREIVYF